MNGWAAILSTFYALLSSLYLLTHLLILLMLHVHALASTFVLCTYTHDAN